MNATNVMTLTLLVRMWFGAVANGYGDDDLVEFETLAAGLTRASRVSG